ncbi:nucleotide kinase domain-containing protein [Kitasatospora cineracea]|uniref:nucleotide kinase domain-containing protein n=1 Tax=Kitasatospora cineracea TaxID=88074 RepID=UPI00244C1EFF|nr:nucleotide kinase domain-containing protein [Kitasatospora cineracea]
MYQGRLEGRGAPWTQDPILSQHRFTNCFRAADRVSQMLIGEVSYRGSQAWEEVFFSEPCCSRIFNKGFDLAAVDAVAGGGAVGHLRLPPL